MAEHLKHPVEEELGQNFLLVDLQDFFFRFRVPGSEKKALKMTSLLVIFRAFFSELF